MLSLIVQSSSKTSFFFFLHFLGFFVQPQFTFSSLPFPSLSCLWLVRPHAHSAGS